MLDLRLPDWVNKILKKPFLIENYSQYDIEILKKKLERFHTEKPVASIILLACNEEEGLLHTIHSLANTTCTYNVELIVINNNSTDKTGAILHKLGIKTLFETRQGVANALQKGLINAKGKYILTAHSDTLYPPTWIMHMTNELMLQSGDDIFCILGNYSFIPTKITKRWKYAFYEFFDKNLAGKKLLDFDNGGSLNCGFVKDKIKDIQLLFPRNFNQPFFEGSQKDLPMVVQKLFNTTHSVKKVYSSHIKAWTSDRHFNPKLQNDLTVNHLT